MDLENKVDSFVIITYKFIQMSITETMVGLMISRISTPFLRRWLKCQMTSIKMDRLKIQNCSVMNNISVISSKFINKFVQKCSVIKLQTKASLW